MSFVVVVVSSRNLRIDSHSLVHVLMVVSFPVVSCFSEFSIFFASWVIMSFDFFKKLYIFLGHSPHMAVMAVMATSGPEKTGGALADARICSNRARALPWSGVSEDQKWMIYRMISSIFITKFGIFSELMRFQLNKHGDLSWFSGWFQPTLGDLSNGLSRFNHKPLGFTNQWCLNFMANPAYTDPNINREKENQTMTITPDEYIYI